MLFFHFYHLFVFAAKDFPYVIILWFQADPSVALEEYILSILVAIARHSPTCAQAIMKCERVVELIINRFTMSDKIDILSLKIKSVVLVKVLSSALMISNICLFVC